MRRTTGKLNAERKRREANLVRISYDDPDPDLALAVVRSAAARYSALRTGLQHRESGQTTDSLRAVADQTLRELTREESALESFQRNARLVAPEAQGEALIARYDEVVGALARGRLDLSRTDEILIQADLVSHEPVLGAQNPDALVNEAVAFLADGAVDSGPDPHADHASVPIHSDTGATDGMQSMIS